MIGFILIVFGIIYLIEPNLFRSEGSMTLPSPENTTSPDHFKIHISVLGVILIVIGICQFAYLFRIEYINEKTILFFLGFLLLFGSIIFHVLKKEKLSLVFLFSSAIILFLFACILDPFLNQWDERFHALVAKNLMSHPLMPTLYDEKIVDMAYDRWDRYHIWLHKQPMFLWQIALSYKIFGVNEFALRLPSAILCFATAIALYRSGKILGKNNVGYYSAFLFISSFYMIQLVSGWQELEHNDVSFIAYISLSIWAWLEYYDSGKKYWIILIGIFSGFAILCKWMAGLLVYLGWGIYSLQINKLKIKKYWDVLISLVITIIIFLPWQLLILKWYPTESAESYKYYSTKHFFEALDGHDGPWYYHFDLMGQIFGIIAPYLLIPALIVFYLNSKDKKIFFAFLTMLLFVYLLFSFAATKMPSFTVILVLPVFISLAFFLDFMIIKFDKLKITSTTSKILLSLFLCYLAFARVDIKALNENHCIVGEETYCRKVWEHNKKIFQNLKVPSNSVLFNVTGRYYVDAMFYSGIPSYSIIPTEKQYLDLIKKSKRIVLFRPKNDTIPDYLKKDSALIILNDTINSCE